MSDDGDRPLVIRFEDLDDEPAPLVVDFESDGQGLDPALTIAPGNLPADVVDDPEPAPVIDPRSTVDVDRPLRA
jgi:hypothetical protein